GTARVAFEQVSLWSVGKTLRDQAGTVAFRAPNHVAVRVEWIPAETEVQYQFGADAVIVLHEGAAERTAALGVFTTTLDEAIDDAEQEIGPGIAAITGPAESEIAVLPESVDQVDLH